MSACQRFSSCFNQLHLYMWKGVSMIVKGTGLSQAEEDFVSTPAIHTIAFHKLEYPFDLVAKLI